MIADVAVIAVTGLNLAIVWAYHKRDMELIAKVADRLRIVNPAKAPAADTAPDATADLRRAA